MLERSELQIISTAASQPPTTLAFLGPPPLAEGEHAAAYDELLARISGALQPADILEDIWIRDVVDLVWDVFRLRRLKANLMTARAADGVTNALERLNAGSSTEVARQWAARDEAAVKTVEAALASAGLTMAGVGARSLSVWLGEFERLERLITSAEGRRHAALRELDRHRATLAQTLRRAVADVEDAEFRVIAPEQPAPGAAA